MTLSKNQKQLGLWGRYFLGLHADEGFDGVITPVDSLQSGPRRFFKKKFFDCSRPTKYYYFKRYWCPIYLRVRQLGLRLGPKRILLLDFDELCRDPKRGVAELLTFLGAPVRKYFTR
jgi:hypothetical protein